MAELTIKVDLGTVMLTVDDIWLDGGAPDFPTAETVAAMLTAAQVHDHVVTVARPVARWSVTVTGPNPHHSDTPALIPEVAPEPTRTTTAVV